MVARSRWLGTRVAAQCLVACIRRWVLRQRYTSTWMAGLREDGTGGHTSTPASLSPKHESMIEHPRDGGEAPSMNPNVVHSTLIDAKAALMNANTTHSAPIDDKARVGSDPAADRSHHLRSAGIQFDSESAHAGFLPRAAVWAVQMSNRNCYSVRIISPIRAAVMIQCAWRSFLARNALLAAYDLHPDSCIVLYRVCFREWFRGWEGTSFFTLSLCSPLLPSPVSNSRRF